MQVFDQQGRKRELFASLGSGGEGQVFKIRDSGHSCAKIYHPHKLSQEIRYKITAMINNPPYDLSWEKDNIRSFAWPQELLFGDSACRQFVGFTMPFIDRNLMLQSHFVYDLSTRIEKKLNFDWENLYMTAINLASVVAAVHDKGHRIGDLRETNILVHYSCPVCIIDCDSFQVRNANNSYFFCRVCTGEYLCPELMGKDFGAQNYDRYYSDLFALGVLLFKILMCGFHPYFAVTPYNDRYNTPEDKINAGIFAYGNPQRGMYPPPKAPPYNILPSSVRTLFNRCFIDGHNNPRQRPSAMEWWEVLRSRKDQIATCQKNKLHKYFSHLRTCPWCQLKDAINIDYFSVPVKSTAPVKSPRILRLSFCSNCGIGLEYNYSYCPQCGTSISEMI